MYHYVNNIIVIIVYTINYMVMTNYVSIKTYNYYNIGVYTHTLC